MPDGTAGRKGTQSPGLRGKSSGHQKSTSNGYMKYVKNKPSPETAQAVPL